MWRQTKIRKKSRGKNKETRSVRRMQKTGIPLFARSLAGISCVAPVISRTKESKRVLLFLSAYPRQILAYCLYSLRGVFALLSARISIRNGTMTILFSLLLFPVSEPFFSYVCPFVGDEHVSSCLVVFTYLSPSVSVLFPSSFPRDDV